MASIQERDQYWTLEAGFDDSGRLAGVQGDMISDGGAYTYQGINLAYNASTNVPGRYVLPHYKLRVSVAETNRSAPRLSVVPAIPKAVLQWSAFLTKLRASSNWIVPRSVAAISSRQSPCLTKPPCRRAPPAPLSMKAATSLHVRTGIEARGLFGLCVAAGEGVF